MEPVGNSSEAIHMTDRGFKHPQTRSKKIKTEVARVCAAIQSRRLDLGMTQEYFAEKANISSAYLARIETGHSVPSLSMLIYLASILKMNIVFQEQ